MSKFNLSKGVFSYQNFNSNLDIIISQGDEHMHLEYSWDGCIEFSKEENMADLIEHLEERATDCSIELGTDDLMKIREELDQVVYMHSSETYEGVF